MTLEEAKRILHPNTSREALAEINEQNGFDREKGIEKVKEACLVACEALEKQIPKKAIRNNPIVNDSWSEDSILCPICHSYVGWMMSWTNKYCGRCGQNTYWSEEVN